MTTDAAGWVGCAEAGQDAPFGPGVAVTCFLDARGTRAVTALKLPHAALLPPRELVAAARKLRAVLPYEVIAIGPARWNSLLKKKDMDEPKLRAWALGKALSGLLAAYPRCQRAVGVGLDELPIEEEMRGAGGELALEPVAAPTEHLASHAAWILARAEFRRRLHRLADEVGIPLPLDPESARKSAKELTAAHGMSTLRQCAKLHHLAFRELG